jgi:integrase
VTSADGTQKDRKRGSIRVRGSSLQVRAYAGVDPVTHRDLYVSESVKGTDRAARREADKVLARLQAQVDTQRSAQTSVTLAYTLDEWLGTVELEDSTRDTYVGYIERTIRPVLGDVPISKLTTRTLELLYAELRRCRVRCDGRPFVEHRAADEHDCGRSKSTVHRCKPMAASTVRQIHAVISGALSAAVRWDWIATNPARGAQRPRQLPSQPDPPSPAEAAALVEGAFATDDDWGTLVWLVMTTGMRRGEVCALRWSRVDLDVGMLDVRRSYRLRYGVGVEKDTKTHQMRRIALDNESVVLLAEYKARCTQRMKDLGTTLTEDMYVFPRLASSTRPSPARPIRSRAATATSPADSTSTPTSTPCATTPPRSYSPLESTSGQSRDGWATVAAVPRRCGSTPRGLPELIGKQPRSLARVCPSDEPRRRSTIDGLPCRCLAGKAPFSTAPTGNCQESRPGDQ